MNDLTPALAGQILVTALLAVGVGLLILAGCYVIYCQYQESRERYNRRMELRGRANPAPHDVTPWIPDIGEDDETLVEDVHHMRAVSEHRAYGAQQP